MSRRCCCGGCKADRSYDAPADWQAQVGGTVEDSIDVSGSLDIDGPVSPTSTPSYEAYLIEFTIQYGGSVDFDFGGIACSIDTVTKVVDAGGNTDEYARPNRDAGPAQVQIRVTPSHILVAARAQYQEGPVQITMALVTVDRTGAVPSFTADWDEATISGFVIKDSKSDTTNELYCFTPTFSDCPYSYLKSATNDHAHDGQSTVDTTNSFGIPIGFVTGDVSFALVSPVGAPDPNLLDDEVNLGAFFSVVVSQSKDDVPTAVNFRNSPDPCFPSGGTIRLVHWVDTRLTDSIPYKTQITYDGTQGAGSVLVGGNFSTVYPVPTPLEPYPKPYYRLQSTIFNSAFITCFDNRFQPAIVYDYEDWEANASIDVTIPVNTLKSGVTASASPTGSWSWRSGSPPPDEPYIFCSSVYDRADLELEVGMSWNI